MYLEGTNKKTTLKKGDRCVWYKNHGTVSLLRGASRLLQSSGERKRDDKFVVRPHDLLAFSEIVQMLAEATGLTPVLEGERGTVVSYCFT